MRPRVIQYLTTASHGASGERGIRNERELHTLALAMDSLLQGDLAAAGDVLMQRFKAVEIAATEQNWDLAKYIEVLPERGASAVTEAERAAASKLKARDLKIARWAQGRDGRSRSPR